MQTITHRMDKQQAPTAQQGSYNEYPLIKDLGFYLIINSS